MSGSKLYMIFAFALLSGMASSRSLGSTLIKATKYIVSGQIADEQSGLPLSDVIVQLIRSKDSVLVKTEFTDEKGTFIFPNVDSGNYFIRTNLLNYPAYASAVFVVQGDLVLPVTRLSKTNINLSEVTVEVKKPYIEHDHGKVIVNVENSINAAGSSAFEIIEKSPGITVNSTDNISFKGRSGIAVQIDGKPTPMTGTDLANYLRGIPSSAIEKIEFIANPSSRYDAAGGSIINIKLKKDKRMGTNGSLTASFGHGVYHKTSEGLNLNHREKKINVFASYNYTNRKGFNHLVLDRQFYKNDTFNGAYLQDNYLIFPVQNHIARTGADFYINPKNTVGLVLNGTSNKFTPIGENVSDVYDQTHQKVSSFKTSNRSKDNWYNYSANLNYKHVFDSSGTELTTDLDYAHFGNETDQKFTTRYYDLAGSEYQPVYLLYGDIHGGLDIYSVKSDFAKPLKKDAKMEAGIKSSYVAADNNLAFYNQSSGQNTYDSTKSNHFIYTENINAAYFNVSKEYKKWSTQLGLRCEQTHVTGKQIVYNTGFDTSYIQLFPSAFVGYTINDKNGLELTYSRRINRPGYDQLNPFKFFLDPSTYKEGNPYLKPQTTHSFEFSHVFKQKIYTTLGYGRTINNITEVLAPSPTVQNTTVQTNINLAQVDVYALNLSLPLEIKKWWNMNTDISSYYASYSGRVANTTLRNSGRPTFNINWVNSFALGKKSSMELTGNYRAPEWYAYDKLKQIWFVSLGFQQKMWDNRAVLKLNVSDIFFSNKTTASVAFTDYKEKFVVSRETRVATVSFTYKFGNSNVAPVRRRTGGADDVKQRAGGAVG
jgi:hypothetical protein